jgi:predicted nucleotidyltransferase
MQDEWLRRLRAWAKANDSVRQLWLFGSRATGRSRPDSDVDLALALMPPKGKHDWRQSARAALSLIDNAAALCECVAEISTARIGASPARQIRNRPHGVTGGAHRLAS